MSSPHDFHRSASSVFSSYDYPGRRRSPSPRRPTYDSYVPHGGTLYRDDYPNCYRPNTWRPERYYSRSPSPGRHDRTRVLDPRHWEQGTRRQSSSYYPDRRSTPGSPRDKPRRDTMAERMLEPSDTWKPPHADRSTRHEPSDPISDRFVDRRPYFARDPPPHRLPARTDYPPHFTGDCYRPHAGAQGPRETYSFPRTADTYRPNYDDELRRQSYSTDSIGSSSYRGRRPDYDDDHHSSSIASTPPRQYPRPPTPHRQYTQPPPIDESKGRTPTPPDSPPYSPRQPTPKPYMTPPDSYHHPSPDTSEHPPYLYQQKSHLPGEQSSYDAQLLYPQRSPTSGEPPRKKFKSRSSSPPSRALAQEPPTISTKQVPPTDHASLQFNSTTAQPETLRSRVHDQNFPQGMSPGQETLIGPSTELINHETAHVPSELSVKDSNLDLHFPSLVTPIPMSADHSTAAQEWGRSRGRNSC
ncbi:hypothetical protein J3A83DRAFT_1136710 [Scleroderma citrinum]